MLDQITELKTFLTNNGVTITAVSLIGAGLLVILSLALREVVAWLTKNDLNRKELKKLTDRIDLLNEKLDRFNSLAASAPAFTPAASKTLETQSPELKVNTSNDVNSLKLFKESQPLSDFELRQNP